MVGIAFSGRPRSGGMDEVSDPKALLPRPTYARFAESGCSLRVICDHIAGMTDSFLLKTYDRLFSPRMGSVFDRL